MKEIKNIVIYNSIENGITITKSCIFYSDGSVVEGNKEDAVVAIKEVAKDRNITSKEELKEMINKEVVYTMTEEEFKERYDSFLPQTSSKFDKTKINEAIEKMRRIGEKETTPIEQNDLFQEDENEWDQEKEKEEEVVLEEEIDSDSSYTDFTDYDEEIEDEELEEVEIEKETVLDRVKEKLKKNNYLALRIVAGITGLTIGVVGCIHTLTHCTRKLTEGTMTDSNISTDDALDNNTTNNSEIENVNTDEGSTYIVNNNDLYNDYSFTELLDVTNNEFQKNSMIKIDSALNGFNSAFAKNYIELGYDVRAALSFDEVVALQQAYNEYSVDEIRAYFNGYRVDAVDMSNAYKSASLQLMGAYVIEDSEHPVDMSILIDSQEGRDFYNRYHAMYLAAKEATGDEQLRLVNEFYQAVREDFPITEEVRTDGISHSEDHNSIKDYQLAVTPMIAAAEMILQNLDVDYTLDDMEVDFINDIGLCNHADDKFESIETIMLSSYEDNENPLYEQYRRAIIDDLVNSNEYVVDDEHRELTKLRRFQEIVNNDPLYNHRTTYTGEFGDPYTNDYGRTSTTTWEETTTTSSTTVTSVEDGGEIPQEDKDIVDSEIASENDQAREEAQIAAEQEAAREQAEANQEAQVIEDEVARDNQQVQEDIDDINSTIDNGGTPNENNYSGIDFDDDHSNSNGDLDSSVQNVTTDGTGADEPLPDPEDYGKDFDERVPQRSYTQSYISEAYGYVEYAGEYGAYVEYGEDYTAYDENGEPVKSKVKVR